MLHAIYTFLEIVNMLLMSVVTIVIISIFIHTHINNKIVNSIFSISAHDLHQMQNNCTVVQTEENKSAIPSEPI